MKHQFVFVRNVSDITPDTVIYHVWVSEGSRGDSYKKAFEKYAAANDCWFEQWAEHVDARIDYYEERVFWSAPVAVRRFRSVHVSCSQMALLMGEDLFFSFEENLTMPRLFFLIMWASYPSYNLFPKNSKWKIPQPTPSRKNLCRRGERSLVDAVIGMGLVGLFYVVGMVLEALEKYLLY